MIMMKRKEEEMKIAQGGTVKAIYEKIVVPARALRAPRAVILPHKLFIYTRAHLYIYIYV